MVTSPSNAGPVLAHTYVLNRWDLLRGQIHVLSRHRVLVALLVIVAMVGALQVLTDPEFAERPLVSKFLLVAAMVAAHLIVILVLVLVFLVLTILFRKGRGVLGEHTLEITPAGLIERTEVNETLHRWQGIYKVSRTRRHLFVWITDSMMHSVPVRSFESKEDARLFQQEIEAHRKVV